MIRFRCSECDEKLQVDDDLAGKNIRCRHCDADQRVPNLESAPTAIDSRRSVPWGWLVGAVALLGLGVAFWKTASDSKAQVKALAEEVAKLTAEVRESRSKAELAHMDNKVAKSVAKPPSMRPLKPSELTMQPATRPPVGGKSPQQPSPAAPVAFGTAMELFREYEDNALAADLNYKGKTVRVRGQIYKLESEGNRHYAGIAAYIEEDSGTKVPSIICYIKESELAAFGALDPTKAPMVDLDGVVVGKVRTPGTVRGYAVVLNDCKLIDWQK